MVQYSSVNITQHFNSIMNNYTLPCGEYKKYTKDRDNEVILIDQKVVGKRVWPSGLSIEAT